MSASLNWIAWKSAIRLAERLALERVREGRVVGGLGDPHRLRGDPDPPAVEGRHRDPEAAVLLAEQAVATDAGVVEADVGRRGRVEAELLLLARDLDVAAVDEEGADAARPLRGRVGAGEDEERAGVAAVRDPLLRAAQPPAVAVRDRSACGASPRPSRRRARSARRRRARGPDARSGTKRCCCSAVPWARIGRVAALVCTATVTPTPGVGARELLEHEHVGEEVRARAAELLRDADAEQAELPELADHLRRERVVAVPGGRVRRDLGLGHLPGERLDRALLGRERRVHRPRV